MSHENKTNQFPPTWKKYKQNTLFLDKLKSMDGFCGLATNENQVFHSFVNICSVKNSIVLEVGGQIAPDLTSNAGIDKWISVDPLIDHPQEGKKFRKIKQGIMKAPIPEGSVDFVFSCNVLQYVSPLEDFFQKIFHILKPGGIAYLHFGPIWSAPDGHHLDIEHKGIVYRFDGITIIPHWYHLIFSPGELAEILEGTLERPLIDKIIQYVFYSPWLNRNFYEDYVNFCLSAGFTIAHLSTGHTIDYEDHVPLYRSPLLNRIKEKNIFTLIRERHGKDKRNFWCRDMLMVLVKPFFCSIDSTQTR